MIFWTIRGRRPNITGGTSELTRRESFAGHGFSVDI